METTYHPGCGGVQVWRLAPPHSLNLKCRVMSTLRVLTTQKKLVIILNIERSFDSATRGHGFMLHSEMEVVRKIRESKDPERAIQIAMDVILDYLEQRESSQSQSADLQLELCAAT